MSDTDMAYIGRGPCGHVWAVTVDRPEDSRRTASTIASWIKRGITIERATVPEARASLSDFDRDDCETCNPPKKKAAKATKQESLL